MLRQSAILVTMILNQPLLEVYKLFVHITFAVSYEMFFSRNGGRRRMP